MPLTPIDVQQKTFGTALRGYDLDEVDDFLDDIVTSLKDYEQRLRDAQERIATLDMEMTDRGDAEGAIARALVSAQRSADSIIADAKSEADRIVADAQAAASEMSKARDTARADAEAEIGRIRDVVADLRAQLGDLAAAVGETLDDADGAIAAAAANLELEESVEAAVTVAEEPQSAWDEPASADEATVVEEYEIDEFEVEEVEEVEVEVESDDELAESEVAAEIVPDALDEEVDQDDGADRDEDSLEDRDRLPDWATGDTDDEHQPVRPWEVG